MKNMVIKTKNKGHFEVEYMDGYAGTAFYDKELDYVINSLATQVPHRTVKSITWIED